MFEGKGSEKSMEKKVTDEYEILLRGYIEIFNRAVKENQDKFPYKAMLENAINISDNGQEIEYVIYDVRPKGSFKLRMVNSKLEVIDRKEKPSEGFYSLSYDYLKDVIDYEEKYLKHPERLNWNWLNK